MSVEDELSMGEASPVEQVDEAPEQVEQSITESGQEPLDPAGFDFKAFVEGTRTARVSHRLYSRADLDVEIAAAANDLHEALSLGVRGLIVEREKRVQALKKQYFASGMDVVLEEKSKDWQARETKRLKDAGVTGEHEDHLLGLLGADETTYDATMGYMFWTVNLGAMPAILNVVMAYLVRAEGASLHASLGTMSGCLLNIEIGRASCRERV